MLKFDKKANQAELLRSLNKESPLGLEIQELTLPKASLLVQHRESNGKRVRDARGNLPLARELESRGFNDRLSAAEAEEKSNFDTGSYYSSGNVRDLWMPNLEEALEIAKELYEETPAAGRADAALLVKTRLEEPIEQLRKYSVLAARKHGFNSEYTKDLVDKLSTFELTQDEAKDIELRLSSLSKVDDWADTYQMGVSGPDGQYYNMTLNDGTWMHALKDLLLSSEQAIRGAGNGLRSTPIKKAIKGIVGTRVKEYVDYCRQGNEASGHSMEAADAIEKRFQDL